jgi:hypothetical protein
MGKGALRAMPTHLSPIARLDGGARLRFARPTDCGLICFAHKRNLDAQLSIAERLLRAAASELRSIAME